MDGISITPALPRLKMRSGVVVPPVVPPLSIGGVPPPLPVFAPPGSVWAKPEEEMQMVKTKNVMVSNFFFIGFGFLCLKILDSIEREMLKYILRS